MERFNELLDIAIKARENSYSPYSNFKVGASVLTKDGNIFMGANIENASYPLSLCAERNALYNAMNHGYKKGDFISLVVVADTPDICSPCGACRQVISELMDKKATICMCNLHGKSKEVTLNELLPFAFTEDDLDV